jgi:hypothetical protein
MSLSGAVAVAAASVAARRCQPVNAQPDVLRIKRLTRAVLASVRRLPGSQAPRPTGSESSFAIPDSADGHVAEHLRAEHQRPRAVSVARCSTGGWVTKKQGQGVSSGFSRLPVPSDDGEARRPASEGSGRARPYRPGGAEARELPVREMGDAGATDWRPGWPGPTRLSSHARMTSARERRFCATGGLTIELHMREPGHDARHDETVSTDQAYRGGARLVPPGGFPGQATLTSSQKPKRPPTCCMLGRGDS